MSDAFEPQLDILPLAQRRLWPELAATPSHFTLYGGTAIALRLGHRQSVDFGFFTELLFEPRALADSIPYLRGATIRQSAANTLTVTVERDGPVRLSFFGGLRIGQVAEAETVAGPRSPRHGATSSMPSELPSSDRSPRCPASEDMASRHEAACPES